ncbi:MAG: response regulator [Bryobacteraceae bacterium]|jgi:DNA-binding NtrC family response regulator
MRLARLLLVDDEGALLELLKKYLERLGFEVDACMTPQDALAQFETDPARYDLVLTDLTLPGMNGEEMLERMRSLNPNLRAILASGYPYHPRSASVDFLQKPFLPRMLAEAIDKILKAPTT